MTRKSVRSAPAASLIRMRAKHHRPAPLTGGLSTESEVAWFGPLMNRGDRRNREGSGGGLCRGGGHRLRKTESSRAPSAAPRSRPGTLEECLHRRSRGAVVYDPDRE